MDKRTETLCEINPPAPPKAPLAPTGKERAAALIAAGTLVASALAAQFEGYVPTAAPDPVGIPTYCFGETNLLKYDPAHIYAKTECMALLRDRMERDYAPKVLKCASRLQTLPVDRARFIFGALVDASYNAGPVAVCASRMVAAVQAGQWRTACDRFSGWYVTARDRRTGKRILLNGLVRRRDAEAATCRKGLAA